ncbi:Uncharacterised protein [Mycobacterium tuberculosis]|nr:Uncharacterised protein [Mycobacterium tuberculosis]
MMVVLKVSVPSRGFGSDDTCAHNASAIHGAFPSPLGVLGLTTRARPKHRAKGGSSFRPLSWFWV